MPSFNLRSRAKNAWNAFMNKDPTMSLRTLYSDSMISSIKPDRIRLSYANERNLVAAVINRIAVDCSECTIAHVLVDENGRYEETIKDSTLNECFSIMANLDQTGVSFIQDAVITLLDEGHIAIVPINTLEDPNDSNPFKVLDLRVGKVTQWMPEHVKISVYNELKGRREEIVISKSAVALVENPFFAIMNESGSLARRISRKLALLDYVDEHNGAGKLDLIIQFPYMSKTDNQFKLAQQRREDIEMQLNTSKFGIAFLDGGDKITQLNRSVDNQLMSEINDLTKLFFSLLGITEEILNGTADPQTLNNYHNRLIVPILRALTINMKAKFLTKTARTQGQSIEFFNDPFKSMPVNQLAETVDKFVRNKVATPNEMRQAIGMKPSKDPSADELRNPNISEAKDEQHVDVHGNVIEDSKRETTKIQ